ncbi:hypothetical protein [Flavobacterium cucumis]|uniref:Uncharacterized protein n=2 Tax=Flavobacterium cucumis TaxID=416016 RepID=A0A1M7ZYD3_9FLAO|nr:hypothetical protein [Flavobacterium cucumis]SHO73889.1 hypothetical protein SAMN05443547_2265 [Flavobacterium cucumis]
MIKLKSYYFILIVVFLTILYSVFSWIMNSIEYNNIIKFFCVLIIIVELSFHSFSKWKSYKNDWKIIGRTKYNLTGFNFFMIIVLIFSILIQLFVFVRDNQLPDFSFFYIVVLSSMNLKQLNYHLIVKQNFVTIIENNYFEDYSKPDIKYIAIKNNNLAIALMKSDKVFNFPIEDFKENELEVLNQFIEVQNLYDYK